MTEMSVCVEEKTVEPIFLDLDPKLPDQNFQGMLGAGIYRSKAEFKVQNGVVSVKRFTDTNMSMTLTIPLNLFYGIALKKEEPFADGAERVSLYLVMDDADIAIPVYHGANTEKLLPTWYAWQENHGLELMIADEAGHLTDLVKSYQPVQQNVPAPRRMPANIKSRRLTMTRRDHFRGQEAQLMKAEVISLSHFPNN